MGCTTRHREYERMEWTGSGPKTVFEQRIPIRTCFHLSVKSRPHKRGDPGCVGVRRGLPITPSCTIFPAPTPLPTSPSRCVGGTFIHVPCCTTLGLYAQMGRRL